MHRSVFSIGQYINWLEKDVKKIIVKGHVDNESAKKLGKKENARLLKVLKDAKSLNDLTCVVEECLWKKYGFPNHESISMLIKKLIEFNRLRDALRLYELAKKHFDNITWLSVNFRPGKFIKNIQLSYSVAKIGDDLNAHYQSFYKTLQIEKDPLSIIFSCYLQHLIYKFSHFKYSGTDYNKKLLLKQVINHELLFYGKNNKVVFWDDGQNGLSALNALCSSGYSEIVKILLKKADTLFEGNLKGYKEFLTHKNNNDFSPLNTASKEGQTKVVKILLEKADILFNGDLKGYKEFLTQKNKYGFSPLDSASKEGHTEVVKILLEKADILFKEDPKGYKKIPDSKK